MKAESIVNGHMNMRPCQSMRYGLPNALAATILRYLTLLHSSSVVWDGQTVGLMQEIDRYEEDGKDHLHVK